MSEKGLSFCSPFCLRQGPTSALLCEPRKDPHLPVPGSSRSAGRGQVQGAQLDLNAVISTGKEAKEEEMRAKEEAAWCW